ncbi:hypothetical protein phytr_10180 [Candidatus Phycorickettsia trachydisci]|uniref:Uncharacterized protein n=1 Tax=Candidatus Phycorickettsia trachydisci TaxID=2115978 RepID=A0A2P1P9K9_9RICK|nr:helicase-related protein [Candidatus Phycorickettsia trachydisci]AVP87946.1 hypothetical protein phytr_10180 [Candidatus Phycorickettsia trachydisci]
MGLDEAEDGAQGTLGLVDPEGEYLLNVSGNVAEEQVVDPKIIQKLQDVKEDISFLYISNNTFDQDKLSEFILRDIYKFVDQNPELLEGVLAYISFRIDPGKLSHSFVKPLRLLHYICDKGYKLKDDKVDELKKVYYSDKCDLEEKNLALDLLSQHLKDNVFGFSQEQVIDPKITQKLQEAREDISFLYLSGKVSDLDQLSELILKDVYKFVDHNPELLEEVEKSVSLTSDPGKLNNSLVRPLKLLKYICDKGYKLKADKIDELGKVFRSDKCDLEARTFARDLLLSNTDDDEVKQRIVAESLDIFYEESDFKQDLDSLKSGIEGVEQNVFTEGVKAITNIINQTISKKGFEFYEEIKDKLEDLVKTDNPIINLFFKDVQNKLEHFVENAAIHEQAYEVDYETVDPDPNEKDADTVFQELGEKNAGFDQDKLNSLRLTYDKVQEVDDQPSSIIQVKEVRKVFIAPEHDENGGIEEYKYSEEGRWETIEVPKAIKRYAVSDIKAWTKALTPEQAQDSEFLPELISVIKRANFLSSGQILRTTQVVSLVTFFHEPDKGMLQEIKTGEGKSTITAALAVMCSLMGYKVDIVTSSATLAKRDAVARISKDGRIGFFDIFGLSVAHNCYKQNDIANVKECYKADIVYGDTSNFQYDWLYESKDKDCNVRGGRLYEVIIVDEADSMFIDESGKIAMVSSGIPGTEYLGPIYAAIWKHLQFVSKNVTRVKDKNFIIRGAFEVVNDEIILKEDPNIGSLPYQERVIEIDDLYHFYSSQLRESLSEILSKIDDFNIPTYLMNLVNVQLDIWVKSALHTMTLVQDIDYVITTNAKGDRVIAPVDYANTGTIHANNLWSNGVHQFLQIKHGLKFVSENLITSFISNISFFKLYLQNPGGKIYGLTGTVGAEDSQKLLKQEYDVNIAFLPRFKTGRFDSDNLITFSESGHIEAVFNNIKEQVEAERAVLVICEDIKFVKFLYDALKDTLPKAGKIQKYYEGSESEEHVVERPVEKSDIIIATNLAGRGTDIKTSQEVEKNGGLHVILTYLPKNLRVEQQAFGRTSRQGNSGTASMIINLNTLGSFLEIDQELAADIWIDEIKALRDEQESFRILEHELYKFYKIKLEDELYEKLCKYRKEIEQSRAKQAQLEQNWGTFLREVKNKLEDTKAALIFKDRIHEFGFKTTDYKISFDSLFKALAHQIGFKLSTQKLKKLLYKVAAKHKDGEASDDDDYILMLFAQIFECNIKILTDDKVVSIDSGSEHTCYLSKFTNNYTDQVTYQSLTPFKSESTDLNHIYGILLKLEEDLNSDDANILEAIHLADKAKADKLNAKIEQIINDDFENFISTQDQKFRNDYQIVTNPAYLVREVFEQHSIRGDIALKLLTLAKGFVNGGSITEEKFTFPAYYNYAYSIIEKKSLKCRKERDLDIKNEYMPQAYTALGKTLEGIHSYAIPNLQTFLLLADYMGECDLATQLMAKVELLEHCSNHIKKVMDKIRNCSKKAYITVGDVKLLRDFYPKDDVPESEVMELASLGMPIMFDVREAKLPVDWLACVAVAVIAVVQICASIYLLNAGFMALSSAGTGITALGLKASVSIGLGLTVAEGGIKDLIYAGKIAGGEQFKLDQYVTSKAMMAAEMALVIIGDKIFDQLSKMLKITPSIEHSLNLLNKTDVIVKETLKYAANKGISYIADHAGKKMAESFEDDIREAVERRTNRFFTNSDMQQKLHDLLAADQANGNHHNYEALQRAMVSAFQCEQTVISSIFASVVGMLKNNHVNHSVGTTLKVVGWGITGAEMADKVKKIENITQKALNRISKEVERLSPENTSQKCLSRYLAQTYPSAHNQIIDALRSRSVLDYNNEINVHNIPFDPTDRMGIPSNLMDYNQIGALKSRLKRIANAYQENYSDTAKMLQDELNGISKSYCLNEATRITHNVSGVVFNEAGQIIHQAIDKAFDKHALKRLEKQTPEERERIISEAIKGFKPRNHAAVEALEIPECPGMSTEEKMELVINQLKPNIARENEITETSAHQGISLEEELELIRNGWKTSDKQSADSHAESTPNQEEALDPWVEQELKYLLSKDTEESVPTDFWTPDEWIEYFENTPQKDLECDKEDKVRPGEMCFASREKLLEYNANNLFTPDPKKLNIRDLEGKLINISALAQEPLAYKVPNTIEEAREWQSGCGMSKSEWEKALEISDRWSYILLGRTSSSEEKAIMEKFKQSRGFAEINKVKAGLFLGLFKPRVREAVEVTSGRKFNEAQTLLPNPVPILGPVPLEASNQKIINVTPHSSERSLLQKSYVGGNKSQLPSSVSNQGAKTPTTFLPKATGSKAVEVTLQKINDSTFNVSQGDKSLSQGQLSSRKIPDTVKIKSSDITLPQQVDPIKVQDASINFSKTYQPEQFKVKPYQNFGQNLPSYTPTNVREYRATPTTRFDYDIKQNLTKPEDTRYTQVISPPAEPVYKPELNKIIEIKSHNQALPVRKALEESLFTNLTGKDAELAIDNLNKMAHNLTQAAFDGGYYKIDQAKPYYEQYDAKFKHVKRQLIKAQPHLKDVVDFEDLYLQKIIGTGQETGTWGHGKAAWIFAKKMAALDNVELVILDRSLCKWLGLEREGSLGQRPDIIVVERVWDGTKYQRKVYTVEIKSNSDRVEDLRDKGAKNILDLPPDMRGEAFVKEVKEVKELVYEFYKILGKE